MTTEFLGLEIMLSRFLWFFSIFVPIFVNIEQILKFKYGVFYLP